MKKDSMLQDLKRCLCTHLNLQGKEKKRVRSTIRSCTYLPNLRIMLDIKNGMHLATYQYDKQKEVFELYAETEDGVFDKELKVSEMISKLETFELSVYFAIHSPKL